MIVFYHLLSNALITSTKNSFIWFALTYWIYLETQSVLSTSIIGGIYLLATAVTSFWFGSLVDHHKKKTVLLGSSLVSLILIFIAFLIYTASPGEVFANLMSPLLWLFVLAILTASVAGNVFGIAIPTLVTTLVPEKDRDKANGLFGSVMGVAFAITSVASGLILGFAGMWWVLCLALLVNIVSIAHLFFIPITEKEIIHLEHSGQSKLFSGTIQAIKDIPGLFSLIFFTTFNNFLGGVFMALMDAYGLSLVSVQVWGILWGFLSFGFIFGGLTIAKFGLGKNPLKTLFRINMVTWTVCIFFTIQPSIVLLAIGIFIWIMLMPFIEATEQTIIQKVVPVERQGRVFGFAHSIEQAASPLTAFLIGPIAQFIFIPFMTTGAGVNLIGEWYGVGQGRGIALVFTMTGIFGLIVTLVAKGSRAYALLYTRYKE